MGPSRKQGPKLEMLSNLMHRMHLRSQGPTILCVMSFDDIVDKSKLMAEVQGMCEKYYAFRSVLVGPSCLGNYYWSELSVSNISFEEKVEEICLDGDDRKAALEKLCGEILPLPLAQDSPQWEVRLVTYASDPSRSDVVWRINHAIGDGILLANVLLNTAKPVEDDFIDVKIEDDNKGGNTVSPKPPARPKRRPVSCFTVFSTSVASFFHTLNLPILPADPSIVLKGNPKRVTGVKLFAISESWDVNALKDAGRPVGATINDLVTSAICGGIYRYCMEKGDPILKKKAEVWFHLLTVVNLRLLSPKDVDKMMAAAETGQSNNDFSYVLPPFPVGRGDTMTRLRRCQRILDVRKRTPEPFFVKYLNKGLYNLVGAKLLTEVTYINMSKLGFGASNLPGPKKALSFAGSKMTNICNVVNPSGSLSGFASFLSYDGKLTLALSADQGVLPDPHVLIGHINDELMECMACCRDVLPSVEMASRIDGAETARYAYKYIIWKCPRTLIQSSYFVFPNYSTETRSA